VCLKDGALFLHAWLPSTRILMVMIIMMTMTIIVIINNNKGNIAVESTNTT
jgi:quinol-cytochrome oxidoreductase complex cytochrome b subunit